MEIAKNSINNKKLPNFNFFLEEINKHKFLQETNFMINVLCDLDTFTYLWRKKTIFIPTKKHTDVD